jgi:Flp pilus assembly protein TadG
MIPFGAAPRRRREGKVLVMLAILLPSLCGIAGLVFDGGLMMDERRDLQHAVDAAATAAATDLRLGKSAAIATSTATAFVRDENGFSDATVTVHIPPAQGPFAGRTGFVEVESERKYHSLFMKILDSVAERTMYARAVAGVDDVTAGAAVVVLDPDPAMVSVQSVGTLPVLPTLTAGFEIEGAGEFFVDGAVLVNTEWGGVDENGDPAGEGPGPPYGAACMPVLPTTGLRARDIRVVGGVDDPDNYANFESGEESPLQANRLPVPDPYASLPVPTVSSDAGNVSSVTRGGVTVAGLPVIGPPVTLQPGVYEYIRIVSGVANFQPGVYIIRGKDPITQVSLCMLAGTINAQDVLFYITDSATFDGVSGNPDASDAETSPAGGQETSLVPSVVIQASLLGSGISGLADASSPFNGMVIYQRRHDRRPIVIAHQNLVGSGDFSGTVYAKWGHVVFIGNGVYDARFVCGTMRVLTLFDSTLAPSNLFPPARDVLLVE